MKKVVFGLLAFMNSACVLSAPVVLHCQSSSRTDHPGMKYTIDVEASKLLSHMPNGEGYEMDFSADEHLITGRIGPPGFGVFFILDRHTLQYRSGGGANPESAFYFRDSGVCKKIDRSL